MCSGGLLVAMVMHMYHSMCISCGRVKPDPLALEDRLADLDRRQVLAGMRSLSPSIQLVGLCVFKVGGDVR